MDVAVSVENVSKKYRIGAIRDQRTFREALSGLFSPRRKFGDAGDPQDLWALRDVSFEVPRGEAIGIVGQNGAGKSTLLKILSRITEPTAGRVVLRGRVSSLLEVGTGFHGELTGRENIALNGAILGMTRKELRDRFDEIVAFAEVERFIDTPVKYYSTGMYMRLAFAVAAHLEPEILIVDEVLAVGDAAFQAKCVRKMSDVATQGRTVLFVSHNMPAVKGLCQTAVWIQSGVVVDRGRSENVVNAYLEKTGARVQREELERMIAELPPHPLFRLLSVRILQNGEDTRNVFNGQPVEIEITYDVFEDSVGFHVYFRLVDMEEVVVVESILNGEAETLPRTKKGRWIAAARIPENFLAPRPLQLMILAAINEQHLLPPSLRVAFDVQQSGIVNRAFPGYTGMGRVTPLFDWRSRRIDW